MERMNLFPSNEALVPPRDCHQHEQMDVGTDERLAEALQSTTAVGCWNCGGPHLKEHCPRVECWSCGDFGHFKTDCPRQRSKKRRREQEPLDQDPQSTLYISELSSSVEERELLECFKPFGARRVSLNAKLDRTGRVEKKFAWVIFATREQALDALSEKLHSCFHGQPMIIRFSNETRESELSTLQHRVEDLSHRLREEQKQLEELRRLPATSLRHHAASHKVVQLEGRSQEGSSQMQEMTVPAGVESRLLERRPRDIYSLTPPMDCISRTSCSACNLPQPIPDKGPNLLVTGAIPVRPLGVPTSVSYPNGSQDFSVPVISMGRPSQGMVKIKPFAAPGSDTTALQDGQLSAQSSLLHPPRRGTEGQMHIQASGKHSSASCASSIPAPTHSSTMASRGIKLHADILDELCGETATKRMERKLKQLTVPIETMIVHRLLTPWACSVLYDTALHDLGIDPSKGGKRVFWWHEDTDNLPARNPSELDGVLGRWLKPFRSVFSVGRTTGIIECPARVVAAKGVNWLLVALAGKIEVCVLGDGDNATHGVFTLTAGSAAWLPAQVHTAEHFQMDSTADACVVHFLASAQQAQQEQ